MINQTHTLDVIPGGNVTVVHVKQYQTDESLIFKLYSRFGSFTISEAYTSCTVRGTKSDGNGYSATATCDASAKQVWVELTEQMTAVAGRQPYEITITDNSGKMITATFILDVQRAALDAGTVESESVIREVQTIVEDYIEDHPGLFVVDDTLTVSGEAADAKVTGDEIADLKSTLNGNHTATPGYILTATDLGSGSTWSPVGLPTDAQTAQAVSDWLDDHPEATTTVQDGAVTEPKLSSELKSKVVHDDVLRVGFLNMENEGSYYGDCTVILGQKNGIVDFGYDSTAESLILFLEENDVTKIDFVVITHYHSDHITSNFADAMDAIIDSGVDFSDCVFYLPHKDISWSSLVGELDYLKDRETAIISYLTENEFEYVYPTNGQTVSIAEALSMTFYNIGDYSDYYNYTMSQEQISLGETNYNVFSLITVLKHYDNSILLTGDLVYPAQEKNAEYIKECDLYKIEHHSLEVKSGEKWLNNLSPKIAVFMPYSSDYTDDNSALCCRTTLLDLQKKGSRIYSTTDGNVVVKSTFGSLEKVSGKPFRVFMDAMSVMFPISSGDDLNDYKDVGNYSSQNGTISASLSHTPYTTGGFLLEVRQPTTYKTASRMQVLYPNSGTLNKVWRRTFASGTWGDWRVFQSGLMEGDTINISGFYNGLVWGDKIYFTIPYSIPFDKGLSGRHSWSSSGGVMIVQNGNVLANSSGFIKPTIGQLYSREYTGLSFRLDLGTALTDDTNYLDKSGCVVQVSGLSIAL